MSLPQHIVYQQGGTIYIDPPELGRPSAVLVSAYNGTAALFEDEAATINALSTTLSSAASDSDTSIDVASATGASEGQTIWLRSPTESARIRSISGTTLTLLHPLRFDHASGTAVEGLRCTYAISAAQADTRFFDGRAKWVFDGAIKYYTGLECTDYPLSRVANGQDLIDRMPQFARMADGEVDLEALMQLAHDDVLEDMGARARARVVPESHALTRAVCYRAARNFYETRPSERAQALYERYQAEYKVALDNVFATIARDEDMDQVAEEHERVTFSTRQILRG